MAGTQRLTPNSAGVTTVEIPNPKALCSCGFAKVAEGFVLEFFVWCLLNLNKRFWITFHVKVAEKVLSAETAEIKY